MSKIKLLQGLASLFKGKGKDVAKTTLPDTTSNISNVFTKNIIDEFGQDEVKKVFKIIGDKDKDPQLAKLFFKPNESRLDEVVNMLESRYMGSERLQAHSISFKRRGSGAAERYLRLNDSGARLTDLPGGPGDRVLYYKHYGEMSGTRNLEGKSVFKNEKPTIFDEGTMLTDEGKTIEGFAMPTDDLSPLVKDMEKMAAEAKAMTEFAKRDQLQISNALDTFNRMIDDGEDPAEALKMLKELMKRTKNAEGGRVGMALGGAAKGIMQAIKLAAKGIKPFGQKQTYKQKVTTKGVSNEQFDEIFKKQLNRVPDEVVDQATGEGLNTSLREAEAIITGQKLGLLSQAQRTKIAKAMTEKVSKQIYDDPNPRLNNDYFEYMDNAVGRMDAILEIEKLGGDLTPKPIYSGKEIIAAGIDFSQLDKLKNKESALDLIKKGIDKGQIKVANPKTADIIPFKPREKKFKGGLLGLLKRINPKLEKDMVKTGPFQTGHRSDIVGDMQQIKNVSRNEGVTLERLDSLYDMVQESPRYNEAMRGAMMKLVDYERFRAILLDDNIKLQRMLKNDPEGSEKFIRMLFREGGSEPQFNLGGLVPPQRGPMSEGMGTLYRSK